MKSAFRAIIIALALTVSVVGQSPSPAAASAEGMPSTQNPAQTGAAPQSNRIPAGVVIPAELSKSINAKKAKSGDKVEAKTSMDLLSNGQVVVPRNSKIVGHVVQAKPHSKESPDSMVGIVFERLTMKDGRVMEMQAAVQAIAPPIQSAFPAGGNAPSSGGGGPTMPSGNAPSASGGQSGTAPTGGRPDGTGSQPSYPSGGTSTSATDNSGSPSAVSALDPHSQGVVGMKGLSLSSSAQGSVISSNSDNVHLDGGTQLILKTQ
jgi:hypothetical protein